VESEETGIQFHHIIVFDSTFSKELDSHWRWTFHQKGESLFHQEYDGIEIHSEGKCKVLYYPCYRLVKPLINLYHSP